MNRRGFFGALVGGIAAATGARNLIASRISFPRSMFVGRSDVVIARLGRHLQPEQDASVSSHEMACWRDDERWSVGASGIGDVQQVAAQMPGHPVESVERSDGSVALDIALRPVPAREEVALCIPHHGSDRIGAASARLCDSPPPQERGENLLQSGDTSPQLSPFGVDLHVLPHDALPPDFDPVAFWERTGEAYFARPRDPSADLPEVWPGFTTPISETASLHPVVQLDRLMELFGASGDAAPSFAAALIGELVLTRLRLADLRRIHAPAGLAS